MSAPINITLPINHSSNTSPNPYSLLSPSSEVFASAGATRPGIGSAVAVSTESTKGGHVPVTSGDPRGNLEVRRA
jgi:hypothetical protein